MNEERTLTAMYDTRGAADMARSELVSVGVPESSMSIRGTETTSSTADASVAGATEDKGFWASLADLFVPDDDRTLYAEGLRRGGYLLTIQVPSGLEEQAIDVLERSEPVDLDSRAEEWRSGGWSSDTSVYAGSTSGSYRGDEARTDEIADAQERAMRNTYADSNEVASGDVRPAGALSAEHESTRTGRESVSSSMDTTAGTAAGMAASASGAAAASTAGRDETIQVMEEQVRIGKREVGRGSVRVRSYVVERPVEEQVQLREEHVSIERRPVDREMAPGETAFQDRTIEAVERGEEAVVQKSARVVEEIGVRKDVDTRTETVRDSVRKTEVEVEDGRTTTDSTGRTPAGTTGR